MKVHHRNCMVDWAWDVECVRCTCPKYWPRKERAKRTTQELFHDVLREREALFNGLEGLMRNVIANRDKVPTGLYRDAKRLNKATKYWKAVSIYQERLKKEGTST